MPASPQQAKEQVLAMDDLTDSDNEVIAPQAQLIIPPVEFMPFPDFNNLQPMIPEEDQLEVLLGWVQPAVADDPPQNHNKNIQLGFVQLHEPTFDPAWMQHLSTRPCHEAVRLWVKHFSNPLANSFSVLIPNQWMNFFSFLLLQSPTFDWASSFL
jgi:hypothetical protein